METMSPSEMPWRAAVSGWSSTWGKPWARRKLLICLPSEQK